MPKLARRIPGRLLTQRDTAEAAIGNIREIISGLAKRKETNQNVIYAELILVLNELDAIDEAWQALEFETREEIKKVNAQ